MGYTSEIVVDVAMHDIDVAFSGLVFLNDGPPAESSREEIIEWAHHLCSYTRYVHLNVWTDRESVRRVKDVFLEEFDKAKRCLNELLIASKELGLSLEEKKSVEHYRGNVTARERNLRERYCRGLMSRFEPSTVVPS